MGPTGEPVAEPGTIASVSVVALACTIGDERIIVAVFVCSWLDACDVIVRFVVCHARSAAFGDERIIVAEAATPSERRLCAMIKHTLRPRSSASCTICKIMHAVWCVDANTPITARAIATHSDIITETESRTNAAWHTVDSRTARRPQSHK